MASDKFDKEIEARLIHAEKMIRRQRMKRLGFGLMLLVLTGISSAILKPQPKTVEPDFTSTASLISVTKTNVATVARTQISTPATLPTVSLTPTKKTETLQQISMDNISKLKKLKTFAVGESTDSYWSGESSIAWSPDGKTIAISKSDVGIQLFSIKGLEVTPAKSITDTRLRGPMLNVVYHPTLEFSPDGSMLAISLDCDNICISTLIVYDTKDWDILYQVSGGGFPDLDFSPDNKFLGYVKNSGDNTVVIADRENWSAKYYGGESWIKSFSYSKDSFTYCTYSTLFIRYPSGNYSDIHRECDEARFTPDGKYLATRFGNRISLETVETSRLVEIKIPNDPYIPYRSRLAYSPDSKIIGVEGVWWYIPTGELLYTINDFGHSMAFSPKGNLIASISENIVTLWGVQ